MLYVPCLSLKKNVLLHCPCSHEAVPMAYGRLNPQFLVQSSIIDISQLTYRTWSMESLILGGVPVQPKLATGKGEKPFMESLRRSYKSERRQSTQTTKTLVNLREIERTLECIYSRITNV